jgi:hypothetical protein
MIGRDDRVHMERAHVFAWPALRTAVIDGWLWRASGGGSQRANSVSTIDFHGERWPASSRQRFGSVKWILCRLGSSCVVAGASRREGVARPE